MEKRNNTIDTTSKKYVILTGRFETGIEEQQQGYIQLFGADNIQYFFDLYFHWYNIIHELGHCIVEKQGAVMSRVDEEMYVNRLAVAYYRYMGEDSRLKELEERLTKILSQFPAPMPEGETFLDFYTRIWNTEQINNVMIYGYFQLNSVLEAFHNEGSLKDVLKEIGIDASEQNEKCACTEEIASANTQAFLQSALKNLSAMGIQMPQIRVELQDDPMIQCAREE